MYVKNNDLYNVFYLLKVKMMLQMKMHSNISAIRGSRSVQKNDDADGLH